MTEVLPPNPPYSPRGLFGPVKKAGKHIKETQNPLILVDRLLEWIKEPSFRNAYENNYARRRKEREEKAKYYNKPFHPEDGQDIDETLSKLSAIWNRMLKPAGQGAASSLLGGLSGMMDSMPGGLGEQMKSGLKRLGIKLDNKVDKDIFIENPDGTIRANTHFFHNLGPNALLIFIFKEIPFKMLRLSIQLPGTFGAFIMLSALGPPGLIIGSALLVMSMKNMAGSITVDFFKRLAQVVYHQVVYGFRGPDGNKIDVIDTDEDGNISLNSEGIDALSAILNSGRPLPEIDDPEFEKLVERMANSYPENSQDISSTEQRVTTGIIPSVTITGLSEDPGIRSPNASPVVGTPSSGILPIPNPFANSPTTRPQNTWDIPSLDGATLSQSSANPHADRNASQRLNITTQSRIPTK